MSRDINDPRVVVILAAFDRAAASPYAAEDEDSILTNVAGVLLDFPYETAVQTSRFAEANWTVDGMRAVLACYALHVPEDELEELTAEAERRLEWCDWWDRPGGGHDECHGIEPRAAQVSP